MQGKFYDTNFKRGGGPNAIPYLQRISWTCPHCGGQMFLVPNFGTFSLRCPREHERYHPQIVTFTTSTTVPPAQEADKASGMTDLNYLSPAALKAAMRGGIDAWGQWGSSRDHCLYVERIDDPRSRRRCHCGCGKRATHRGMANGVCLSMGCELSMMRWARRVEK